MSKPIIKNAMLRKDMLQDMKKPKIAIIMLIFNIIISLIAAFFLGSIGLVADAYSYGVMEIDYRILIYMLLVMIWLEAGGICMITPALTAGCISIEKERQTLDVLLTTKMSTWQIICGKYFSSIMLVIMLIISGMPIMSLVYIYGGINLGQLFLMIIVLITTTMFLACFGVFFSALVKNTIGAVILSYIAIFIFLGATVALPCMGWGAVQVFNEYLEWELGITPFIHGDGLLLFMWFNPLVTIFDSTAQIFGYGEISGMQDLGRYILQGMSDKNILLRGWSFFSVATQLLCSFLLLKWSAYLLKPVKKKPKKFVSNLKR